MTAKQKSIYEKLADARSAFHKLDLKKSGKNKFAGYSYFELGDFLIQAMECLKAEGLVSLPVTYDIDYAYLVLREFSGDGEIITKSPMAEANLKGCHPIQNLGAVETYQRRYLWVSLMEITEHDALDSAEPAEPQAKKVTKKKVAKKTAAKKPEPVSNEKGLEVDLPNEEEAERFIGVMIQQVKEMHSNSMENLVSFWQGNLHVVDYLSANYPNQYETLKNTFTEVKQQLMENEE